MRFVELEKNKKDEFSRIIKDMSEKVGGINYFLQLLDDIRDEKPHPLTDKSSLFRYKRGKVSWNKHIYKNTLYDIQKIVNRENILENLDEKEKKRVINLLRTLKPLEFFVEPNIKREDGNGFSFKAVEMIDDKNSKFTEIFKIIFFYDVEFSKKALQYATPKDTI